MNLITSLARWVFGRPVPQELTRLSPGEYWLSHRALAVLEPALFESLPEGPVTVVLDDGTQYHVME